MAAILPAGHDRLVMLGFGLATCALMEVMRRMLVHYRDAAQVPPYQSKPQYITQDVEDSLKISTLEKLLNSSNYCIQETTSIIVCERALHDQKAINALLWYITRPEHDSREKGIRALTMLTNSSTVGMINKPEAWAALVKSLEYSITDYPHNTFDPEWDNWHLRDAAEKDCLMVLAQLVEKFGVEGLVNSRFVERWLAKEPWGDAGVDRMIMFADSLHSNHRLSELVVPLFRDSAGRQQLVKAKLVPAELLKDITSREVRMINGEGTAGEEFEGMLVDNRRRRDQNSEEDQIRRRHREAMVLNDGTRPLERSDIIQRER